MLLVGGMAEKNVWSGDAVKLFGIFNRSSA